MTQDEIIRVAREADAVTDQHQDKAIFTLEQLERFAALVAAHEAEKCAKVCDDRVTAYQYATDPWAQEHINEARHIAAAIRARSENGTA